MSIVNDELKALEECYAGGNGNSQQSIGGDATQVGGKAEEKEATAKNTANQDDGDSNDQDDESDNEASAQDAKAKSSDEATQAKTQAASAKKAAGALDVQFDDDFVMGTSTAVAQIETAAAHNWRGVHCRDGFVFQETAEHEARRDSDVDYIAYLGNAYRFGVDWSRLQSAPLAPFDEEVVAEYARMIGQLRERGVKLMFVLHHFMEPLWFSALGGWHDLSKTKPAFLNFVDQCLEHFGASVSFWNTFNEPNVYVANGYITGQFPPFQRLRYFKANKIVRNMAECHVAAAKAIKAKFADAEIGISLNTVLFKNESFLSGAICRKTDWWHNEFVADLFAPECTFQGFSYYAEIRFQPLPLVAMDSMDKVKAQKLPHDDMWIYNPEGMYVHGKRLHERFKLPLVITESGCATKDSAFRIQAIKDYLGIVKRLQNDGVPVRGYFHWATFDNIEWNLGFAMRFGLVHVDNDNIARTFNRHLKRCGEFYHRVVQRRGFDNDDDVEDDYVDPFEVAEAKPGPEEKEVCD